MSNQGEGSSQEHLRDLQAWRLDAAREMRALEKRVDAVVETVARNTKRINNLTRTADIADAVAQRLQEHGRRRLEWWHVVIGLIAILPAYVTMIVLLSRLG